MCLERAQKTLVLHSAETDFHCHKKQGRTFHMVTVSNSSGEAVVQYFSGQTDEQPDACGSFVRLKKDDNSKLVGICKDWGLVSGKYFVGKWGNGEDEDRLYRFPAFGQPSIILRSTWITLVTCTTWNAMISPLRLLTQLAISEESFFVSCVWLRAVCNLCNPWLCE